MQATLRIYLYKHSQVSYYRFGQGAELMVAFHGYNQTGEAFVSLTSALGNTFTIIAIDFFWHGQSEWNQQHDFTDADMKNIVMGIAHQEQLAHTRFSICSFSMGARMARALLRNFATQVNYLILLSPPTFAFNTFLNFTTNNRIGLWCFRYFVSTPGALMHWVEQLKKWHILNRSIYLFTTKFVSKPQRVEKVFKTWYAQRKLKTNFKQFANLLNAHQIKTILIVGKNDKITPPHGMIKYVKKLNNRRIFILQKKHDLATPETIHVLEKIFATKQS